ncbi:uncharacterized protein LOC134753555 [Cydia strobilella]|uniref:uncharacterized protein LOC134753555 n=1 Tax=Cydia strobilella TaxID=1100964 RepID=UPI00300704F4
MPKTSRAVILTTILAASLSVTQSKRTYGNVPDVLNEVLIKYEGIYNNSNNNDKIKDNRRSSFKDPDIERAIRKKITELKPILDDDRIHDSNGKIDDRENGESFIDSSKTGQVDTPNQKYKKMRNEIEKLLKVEPISVETKRIVIEALDQIETELNMNDCVLKKAEGNVMRRGKLRRSEPSIVIPKNMAQTELIMKHIKEKWDKVVSQYSMPADSKTHNDTTRKVAFVFLTQLRQFVFDVHDDYTKLQNKYTIKCSSNKIKIHAPIFKQTKELNSDDTCSDLVICSAELLDFLADFYNQLNETCSEVFRNYIEMYEREVEAGKDEKKSFKNVLELILDHARDKIKKMFSKELENLNEILNNLEKRSDGLKNIIDRTVDNSKELIYASLSMKLKKLKPKLRLTIKEDIDVSIGIELGNLQKVFKDKMCVVFRTCNGDIALRKSITGTTGQDDHMDPNSIKIRLRLGPIIPYKRNNYDHRKKQLKGHTNNTLELNDKVSARKINIVKSFNISEYTRAVNVTRTTYAEFTEKATTVIMGNSSQVEKNVTESEDSLIFYF